MARGNRPEGDAPEPLARLLARSDAVIRELERARRRLDDLEERFDADEPLVADASRGTHIDEPDPRTEVDEPTDASDASDDEDLRSITGEEDLRPITHEDLRPITTGDVIEVPDADPRAEPDTSRDRDISMLQEAARRRLSDER